jgi:hypothetical protein
MKIATPPNLTGNPGQPRDLQFYGPFLGMPCFRRKSDALRPKRLTATRIFLKDSLWLQNQSWLGEPHRSSIYHRLEGNP